MRIYTYVHVYGWETNSTKRKVIGQVALPGVMRAPIRPDIVSFVHNCMAKNKRQPFGVKVGAGYDTSAASWGTGRAVARIPRVAGGGTHRSAQGAFGNMCRGGGMFAPNKIWKRWHRHINLRQKRYALASAIASTAFTGLVLGRGHRISDVPELPLIVSDDIESMKLTKDILDALKSLGCKEELEKAKDSQHIRAGRGKSRNRRYTGRLGPLIIYKDDKGIVKASSNIPGVRVLNVTRLNLLHLAPGGTLGRFVIWTQSAFSYLHTLFKNSSSSTAVPRRMLENPDTSRIINSDEIQHKLFRLRINRNLKKVKARNFLKSKLRRMQISPLYKSRVLNS